jgi:flagellar biosynthesis/type III secretory pathway chaperone
MVEKYIKSLIQLLGQEIKVYEETLKVSKVKTKVIIAGKVSELENVIKQEQALILKVGDVEEAREEIVKEVSLQLGLESDEVTVSELIKHAKQPYAEVLRDCQSYIMKLVNELKDVNFLNSRLIKNSLEYIDFSINLLANVSAGNNSYGSSGETTEHKKRNFFDMKL